MAHDLFEANHEEDVMSDINMTPLIDVMLVLLIIFMVTLPVMRHAAKVDLPQANSQLHQTKSTPIKLIIHANGEMRWEQDSIDQTALQKRLLAAAQSNPSPELHLYIDRTTHYEYVAQVISAAQTNGLTKINLVTEAKP